MGTISRSRGSIDNIENILPATGLVRLSTILRVIPVSKSTWWAGVKSGRFPQPIKLGPRTTCWYTADILLIVTKPAGESGWG